MYAFDKQFFRGEVFAILADADRAKKSFLVKVRVEYEAWALRGGPHPTPTSGPGVRVWTGMRPMTPDGLPVIGWLPGYRNIALASGHAMMGVTLATPTAEAVADLLTTGDLPEVARPFDPARFA